MSHIHEVRRYDGKGNLIGVISPEECQQRYWAEFGDMTTQQHTPETISNMGTVLVRPIVKRTREMTCVQCGKKFMGTSRSKFCTYTGATPAENNCKLAHYRAKTAANRAKVKPKECVMCKRSFLPIQGQFRKFCRNPCTHELLIKSQQLPPKEYDCISCGKKFMSVKKRGYAKYCQNPCTPTKNAIRRAKAKKRWAEVREMVSQGKPMIAKTCSLCEKDFLTHKKNRVYCGDPCSDNEAKRLGRATVLCKLCKDPIESGKPHQKYCQKPCNYELYHAQMRRNLLS